MNPSFAGVFGMGVMGQSLALNISNHNYSTSVFNIDSDVTDFFLKKTNNKNITPTYSLEEFISSLESPKKIILMVTAGKAVDEIIENLIPLLEKGDLIIDCGNSYFKDTIRREKYLKEKKIYFVGVGISGGEKGALEGPSIMPSGDIKAYKIIEKMLLDISAKAIDGKPCCTYIGDNGAGHFVKMIHNGIEYADIQIICDVYQMMRDVLKMNVLEMQSIFKKWNEGPLQSYLIEITSKVLGFVDEKTGKPILDIILDKAGQKGTGKWTSIEGLNLGVPVPSITEAVFFRYISDMKQERIEANKIFSDTHNEEIIDKLEFINKLEEALYAAKICVYAQGYELMERASEVYNWNLNLGEISLIWRAGCIIQAKFLNDIKDIYDKENDFKNLILSKKFSHILENNNFSLREVCVEAINNGIALTGLSSTLNYFDSYRTEHSSANLLQALRDFFGAHTYERIDSEGFFHTIWE